jgi:hypothetical protein
LRTTQVGKEKKWSFPYLGRGFAWAKGMQGQIAGSEASLGTNRVGMEKKWRFPYFGYGYAWMRGMSGECGDQLKVGLSTTDFAEKRDWGFPYFGFGFAWANRGVLTVTLTA